MTPRTSTLLVIVSAAVMACGAVVCLVYVVQPWRSCSYEDTSAGCAMLPQDAAVMGVAMLITVIAFLVLTLGIAARLSHRGPAPRDGARPSSRGPSPRR
ncbi:hypothetical protein [Brachybacterium sp. UNK5269]|uniref:hypothetical protein n=1 Tax=Brachybacterium sp. UNK5269 TaxID=3408576 RepID=UPI003BAF0A66